MRLAMDILVRQRLTPKIRGAGKERRITEKESGGNHSRQQQPPDSIRWECRGKGTSDPTELV
jgi:hypothetical protein